MYKKNLIVNTIFSICWIQTDFLKVNALYNLLYLDCLQNLTDLPRKKIPQDLMSFENFWY